LNDAEGVGFVGVEVEIGCELRGDANNNIVQDATTRAGESGRDGLTVCNLELFSFGGADVEMTGGNDDSLRNLDRVAIWGGNSDTWRIA